MSEVSLFEASNWQVAAVRRDLDGQILEKINNKTKPPGALGQLEDLALQLARLQQTDKLVLDNARMLVFAADHGIADEGVSIAGAEVTRQMVLNFLQGGAAINCFCRSQQIQLSVIDAGILSPVDDQALLQKRIAAGTRNLAKTPAMSIQQANQCLAYGAEVAREKIASGADVLCFGEMGIANTSSASAMLSALTDWPVSACTGKGTGIGDQVMDRKMELIQRAVDRFQDQLNSDIPLVQQVLAQLGGFEIGQIAGAMLATAEAGKAIVVDGFIVSVAALLALKIQPNIKDYLFFAHCSEEFAHKALLDLLQVKPVLNLGLRLGEGTGAALVMPVLRAAASFYNDMASFESAGVTV